MVEKNAVKFCENRIAEAQEFKNEDVQLLREKLRDMFLNTDYRFDYCDDLLEFDEVENVFIYMLAVDVVLHDLYLFNISDEDEKKEYLGRYSLEERLNQRIRDSFEVVMNRALSVADYVSHSAHIPFIPISCAIELGKKAFDILKTFDEDIQIQYMD